MPLILGPLNKFYSPKELCEVKIYRYMPHNVL